MGGAKGELMAIIAHTENAHILSGEWLDEDDVDLSGITVPQDDTMKNQLLYPLSQ